MTLPKSATEILMMLKVSTILTIKADEHSAANAKTNAIVRRNRHGHADNKTCEWDN